LETALISCNSRINSSLIISLTLPRRERVQHAVKRVSQY
jgi:hypothetical protein